MIAVRLIFGICTRCMNTHVCCMLYRSIIGPVVLCVCMCVCVCVCLCVCVFVWLLLDDESDHVVYVK